MKSNFMQIKEQDQNSKYYPTSYEFTSFFPLCLLHSGPNTAQNT